MSTFGFILNESPHMGQNFLTLYHMAMTALEKDHRVVIYLQHDGVYGSIINQVPLNDNIDPRIMMGGLIKAGARIICSQIDMEARNIDGRKSHFDGVITGGLSDMAEELSGVDRLITL